MVNWKTLLHPESDLVCSAPLASLSHFGSGGPAECLVRPHSLDAVIHVARTCLLQDIPLYVLGQMSNVLVSDKGIPGVTMLLTQDVADVQVSGVTVRAEAGIWLSRLSALAAAHGLSGLEFACGIPGTLGGSILINAGAYNGQFSEIVTATTYLNERGDVCVARGDEHEFGYRTSRFESGGELILSCEMRLVQSESGDIYRNMAELAKKRRDSQPLADKSCGSAFKRPPGHFAGKLISDSGLKGYTGRHAGVSPKHAGFIVNYGNAASQDIADVFIHVQQEVARQTGVLLEPEVRFAGEFDRQPQRIHKLRPLFGRE